VLEALDEKYASYADKTQLLEERIKIVEAFFPVSLLRSDV
jgi:hypothetical protein